MRVTLEFSAALSRIPVYPAANGYALGEPVVRLASNESPYPPIPAVVGGDHRVCCRRSTATPTRAARSCGPPCRTATACRADRIAVGNGSCDLLLAAGQALLEPGAELVYAWPSFSEYPHLAAASGARGDPRPARRATSATISTRCAAEITVATRLVIVCNPNNPTSTALPLDDIAAFVAEVPRQVCVILDEAYCEFNLLDDPDASVGAAGAPSQPRAAADVLEGVRAVRPAGRLRAVRI